MQTFLPYPDVARSAAVLDAKRLGRQRGECKQLLNALTVRGAGYRHHPAALMWKGHEAALCVYAIAICTEWRRRGFRDTCLQFFCLRLAELAEQGATLAWPSWWGYVAFHKSHQSNLVRKNPEHYRQYFPVVSNALPYVWPTP